MSIANIGIALAVAGSIVHVERGAIGIAASPWVDQLEAVAVAVSGSDGSGRHLKNFRRALL
jgi:hypothetical protein